MIEPLLTPVGALVLAVGLYYMLGSRFLGPDDQFWRPVRRTTLPALDRVFERTFGGFAAGPVTHDEHAAEVYMTPERFGKELAAAGADRNPAAALKTDPEGKRLEYASWAFRDVSSADFDALLERLGPVGGAVDGRQLRAALDAVEAVPGLGDVVETVEAIAARRQVHITLFVTVDGHTDVFVHEEANSLNPFTAQDHYRAESMNVELGVCAVHRLLDALDVDHAKVVTFECSAEPVEEKASIAALQ